MIFPKGGVKVENTVLFGKYQVCRTIGHGRSGTVFLVKHLTLKEYRAVKRVSRDRRDEQSLLREAMILKALKHPGIPIVYDLEQDEHYYYLIEEYLDGESLFALVNRQGGLSRAETISYGIELCQIMNYLHSLEPNPILYLDLQPKNLLICDGALKLIDFDQAVSACLTGSLRERYGTAGFAAPEQYSHTPMDLRTDIYAIGALLHYMGTGILPNVEHIPEDRLGKPLSDIIRQCLRPSMEERYADAACVLEELVGLKSGVFAENQISPLSIAVVGSSQGVGATHASFGISSYLSGKGFRSIYKECNTSGMVKDIANVLEKKADRHGIFHIKNLELRPHYGECVRLDMPQYDAVIHDFGDDVHSVCGMDFQIILLLCGSKWWERPASDCAVSRLAGEKNLRVIFNHVPMSGKVVFPKECKALSCYRMPYFPESESADEKMQSFWDEVFAGTDAEQILCRGKLRHRTRERRAAIRKKLRVFLHALKKC